MKEFRIRARLSQKGMSELIGIPIRTIEDWESGRRKCPEYVKRLICEKLEGIIMERAAEILKKAESMDEFNNDLPQVEVGETCTLADVWNGAGDHPTESYSYQLTDTDWINYEFEIIEEKEDALETIIKITNIDLI